MRKGGSLSPWFSLVLTRAICKRIESYLLTDLSEAANLCSSFSIYLEGNNKGLKAPFSDYFLWPTRGRPC